ncbi:MAG: DUF92 domain-containing protein [Anaerolineae bacterium]
MAFSVAFSSIIAWAGYRGRSLSPSGVVGAIIVGTLTFGLGGWTWGLLLIAFFISSSLLSRYRQDDKRRLAEKFAKTGQRDLGQALANGGWGAILAIAYSCRPDPILFAAFVGTIAAVNADTWATELGVLSAAPPRLMTTRQRVPVGTSGGVTSLGTMAAFGGGLLIGLAALVLGQAGAIWGSGPLNGQHLWLVPIGILGGLAGSTFDSLLGATVQGIYYCSQCQKETESKVHRCGQPARHLRGWRWLNNDLVNFASSIVGSLMAGFVGWLVF